MREIRTSGSRSGDVETGWGALIRRIPEPRPSSTLPSSGRSHPKSAGCAAFPVLRRTGSAPRRVTSLAALGSGSPCGFGRVHPALS